MAPKVSVIIPLYNHAAYVPRAVESVLTQTLADLELIVVNDGSTDNSLEVVRAIRDPRLRVLDQKNQGAHAAINRGLSEAKGDFLAILNSDDVFHPARLAKLIPPLEANPDIGLAASYLEVIDQHGKSLGLKEGYKNMSPWPLEYPAQSFRAGSDLRLALLTENYLSTTSNYVFTRGWFARVGAFRGLRFVHDWDFALRVAAQAHLHLHPEPLMQYRVHPTNTIRQNQVAMIFEICWILAVHLPPHLTRPPKDDTSYDETSNPALWGHLYHSLYTFGCDRILTLLLLQRLSENPTLAEALLESDNPHRLQYLEWIATLTSESAPRTEDQPSLRRWLRKLKR